MNPVIIQIVEFVLQLLKDCPAPEKQRFALLRKPKAGHRLRLALKARRAGIKPDEYKAALAELEAIAQDATDAELRAILADAKPA